MSGPFSQVNPNDAAFASDTYGLTKREYFAAMALQGALAANPDLDEETAAQSAVEAADALIKQLNK